MNKTIIKTKTCCVCNNYELWLVDDEAVIKWQAGENIQRAFPDMSAEDREVLISGTHPECWSKLFGEGDSNE